jgi:hypothetical protein
LWSCPARHFIAAEVGDEGREMGAALPLLDHAFEAVARTETAGRERTGAHSSTRSVSSGLAGLAGLAWQASWPRLTDFADRALFAVGSSCARGANGTILAVVAAAGGHATS